MLLAAEVHGLLVVLESRGVRKELRGDGGGAAFGRQLRHQEVLGGRRPGASPEGEAGLGKRAAHLRVGQVLFLPVARAGQFRNPQNQAADGHGHALLAPEIVLAEEEPLLLGRPGEDHAQIAVAQDGAVHDGAAGHVPGRLGHDEGMAGHDPRPRSRSAPHNRLAAARHINNIAP